jgi:hypothetical protein
VIEIRLFGDLRRHVADSGRTAETVLHWPADRAPTVGRVLDEIGIDPAEVSHVFLNGRLIPRSNYPILLGYQLAADEPLPAEAYLAVPVQTGDRLGVFPRKMGVVVV